MAENGQPRSEVRRLLDDAGHRPNKNRGQNFLTDPNIVDKIVEVANVDDSAVIEIGAGTGALTAALAKAARRVIAYEIDEGLRPILDHAFDESSNVELRYADAASLDFGRILDTEPWTMVSNLPYNVGTGIILDALRTAPMIVRFVVMVQREVGDRLLAQPGSRTYGLPSVVVGLHATGRQALTVPAHVFEPAPRVESSVVVLERTNASEWSEGAIAVAMAAFNQRRKMLRKSLATMFVDPVATLEASGIDPTLRPEQLSPLDYVAIAKVGGVA
ncbi:MAG: 16S rRNA (adenine(1518)-N(6)/adenine(1519)-N(6))-dimethyltransferase RsmA [Acidimicrobiia bacterium]